MALPILSADFKIINLNLKATHGEKDADQKTSSHSQVPTILPKDVTIHNFTKSQCDQKIGHNKFAFSNLLDSTILW